MRWLLGNMLLTAAAEVDFHVAYEGCHTAACFEQHYQFFAPLLSLPLVPATLWHHSLPQCKIILMTLALIITTYIHCSYSPHSSSHLVKLGQLLDCIAKSRRVALHISCTLIIIIYIVCSMTNTNRRRR